MPAGEEDNATELWAEDRPFLAPGGGLGSSCASDASYMRPVWPVEVNSSCKPAMPIVKSFVHCLPSYTIIGMIIQYPHL